MRTDALLILSFIAGSAIGCLERRSPHGNSENTRCTSCHGNPDAPSSALIHSAPPNDLYGNQTSEYPGVGSHALHLQGGPTHAAFECRECHVVPRETHDPGHIDSDRPAEVVFGALATRTGTDPSYDASARRCSNVYCHGADEPLWTAPRTSGDACGSCHGVPPKPPHPQSEACSECHSNVRADRSFVDPAQHVNGTLEVEEPACSACHGEGDNPAPPADTLGNTQVSAAGVGAHDVHVFGGGASRPVECEACHEVPRHSTDPGHIDPAPAELVFSGIARAHSREPAYDGALRTCADSWCHAPGDSNTVSPEWTSEAGALPCTGCHGMPPELPHPQLSNCSLCHGDVVGPDMEIIDRLRHVDGIVDVIDPETLACNACHGSETAAPPSDLAGQFETSAPGVGAHATHLQGSDRARAVACAECHRVPTTVGAPGHMDDDGPAEIVFSGPARAFDAQPSYANGVCSNTFCHGDSFVGTRASGGSVTRPRWTTVDGSQASCGGCHALPPPPPHPVEAEDCSRCHENIDENGTFTHPELHVDGVVTFLLP